MDTKIDTKALPSTPVWSTLSLDFGFSADNRQKLYELMSVYQKNDVVHACVNINATAIVAAKPCLFKIVNAGANNLGPRNLKRISTVRTKKLKKQWYEPCLSRKDIGDDEELVEVTDHDFLSALNNPINDLCFTELLYLTAINLSVYSLCFWAKERDALNRVVGYQYLPAYDVSANRGADGTLIGWFYNNYNDTFPTKQPIAKEDMVVFRRPSPTDPHAGGDSDLLAALRKVELSSKWLDFENWLLNNRARPDAMFIPKMPDGATLDDAQISRLEKKFNDKFRGEGNGRIGVGEQPGSLVPLTFSPTDLAPLQFNEELKKALLFVMKIPEGFSNNDGNRANLEASLEQWARQSLSPLVTLIEAVLNTEAATEFDPTLCMVFENVIPEDEAFELEQQKFELSKWVAGLQFGGLQDNDYRVEILGLDPIDEPEPEPVVPPVAPDESESSEAAPDEPQPEQQAEKSLDLLLLNRSVSLGEIDRATAISVCAYTLGIDEADAKKLVTKKIPTTKAKHTAMKPLKVPSSDKLADAIRKNMDRQKTHYIAELNGHGKSFDGVEIKSNSDGLPNRFTKIDQWDAEDQMDYKPYIQVGYEVAANSRQKAYVGLGVDEDTFAVVPKEIDIAVDHATLQFAESTNETTEQNINDALDQLREALKNGLDEGDSVANMAKHIEQIFENIDTTRAELIARTEMSRATHEAQKITAKASGVVNGFVLQASDDCCDICQDLDGTKIGLDGSFTDDDYSDTPVPIHPFCRCTMLEDIDVDALLGDD